MIKTALLDIFICFTLMCGIILLGAFTLGLVSAVVRHL